MRKISQAEFERRGGTVKPSTKAKPTPKKTPPKDEVGMASMGASMKHLEAQAKATQQVIAHNSAVIESFKIELATAVEAVGEPVTYVHDIERDEDRLLKRITSTPQKR